MINHHRINELLNDPSLDDDDANFFSSLRHMLITRELHSDRSNRLTIPQRRAMLELRDLIAELDRHDLTELLLDFSICPLHRIDYAICFDDDDPECAAIRMIHPNHDI